MHNALWPCQHINCSFPFVPLPETDYIKTQDSARIEPQVFRRIYALVPYNMYCTVCTVCTERTSCTICTIVHHVQYVQYVLYVQYGASTKHGWSENEDAKSHSADLHVVCCLVRMGVVLVVGLLVINCECGFAIAWAFVSETGKASFSQKLFVVIQIEIGKV